MKTLSIILLALMLISCNEEGCADEDKIVKYTENTTYYYTVMEPELVCP